MFKEKSKLDPAASQVTPHYHYLFRFKLCGGELMCPSVLCLHARFSSFSSPDVLVRACRHPPLSPQTLTERSDPPPRRWSKREGLTPPPAGEPHVPSVGLLLGLPGVPPRVVQPVCNFPNSCVRGRDAYYPRVGFSPPLWGLPPRSVALIIAQCLYVTEFTTGRPEIEVVFAWAYYSPEKISSSFCQESQGSRRCFLLPNFASVTEVFFISSFRLGFQAKCQI